MAAENGGERALAHSLKSPSRPLSGKPDIEPTSPNVRFLTLGPLVTDRAMEGWYHPSIA
jgi:hypothetical protein